MKKILTSIIATLFICGVCLAIAFAAEEPQGPITVTNFKKTGAVVFKHSTHKKNLKCESCHHKKESNNYKCGTADCHQSEQVGKAIKIKDAAHKDNVGKCWSCHFKKSPKAEKPMKCKECHQKK